MRSVLRSTMRLRTYSDCARTPPSSSTRPPTSPTRQIRFPNMRVVPLYVRFGEESFRDYVELDPHEFYNRLRTAPELPTTSQPTPQDFLATYEALAGYERIYSLHISSKLSGTFQSASLAAADGGDRVRLVDTESASVGIAMLALGSRSCSSAGRPTRRSRRSPSATANEPASSSPSTRSSSSPRAAGSAAAQALMGSLLNVKPILAIEDGEVVPLDPRPRPREGARRVPQALRGRRRPTARASGRDRPRRGAGRRRAAAGDRAGDPPAGRGRSS